MQGLQAKLRRLTAKKKSQLETEPEAVSTALPPKNWPTSSARSQSTTSKLAPARESEQQTSVWFDPRTTTRSTSASSKKRDKNKRLRWATDKEEILKQRAAQAAAAAAEADKPVKEPFVPLVNTLNDIHCLFDQRTIERIRTLHSSGPHGLSSALRSVLNADPAFVMIGT